MNYIEELHMHICYLKDGTKIEVYDGPIYNRRGERIYLWSTALPWLLFVGTIILGSIVLWMRGGC